MGRTSVDKYVVNDPEPRFAQILWRKQVGQQTHYLRRWGLRTPWFSVYLHRYGGDPDEFWHTHPWTWWRSIVLCGSISEERLVRTTDTPPPWTKYCLIKLVRTRAYGTEHQLGASFHRISLAKRGTWTLFWTGRRVRQWYLVPDRDAAEQVMKEAL